MTQIWGHRGASADAPENTLPAFELALVQGADGVELDVQLSSDGEVVVIHDETLDRTTDGTGPVGGRTWAELRALDASGGRPGFAGTRIPLLAEVLELTRGTNAVVNVELKTDQVAYPGIEAGVLEVVRASGVGERVLLSSFNHETLGVLRRLGAEQRLGALVEDRWFASGPGWPGLDVVGLGLGAVHPSVLDATASLLADARERGLAVNVWTVNEPLDLHRLFALGVDAIMTDVPTLAVRLRGERDDHP